MVHGCDIGRAPKSLKLSNFYEKLMGLWHDRGVHTANNTTLYLILKFSLEKVKIYERVIGIGHGRIKQARHVAWPCSMPCHCTNINCGSTVSFFFLPSHFVSLKTSLSLITSNCTSNFCSSLTHNHHQGKIHISFHHSFH